MTAVVNFLSVWRGHLEEELKRAVAPQRSRAADFDMDDEPEFAVLDKSEPLYEALSYLKTNLLPAWRMADSLALRNQSRHRKRAKTTIFCGTSAIILAIIQLAVARQTKSIESESIASLTFIMELTALVAGGIAVAIGLWTKGDRKWLCERNRAERLRMLKFNSLGWEELLRGDLPGWKKRFEPEMAKLSGELEEEDLRKWAESEHMSFESASAAAGQVQQQQLGTLASYYEIKRLEFQRNYFKKRSEQHLAASRPWRHLSVPVFLTSTFFVIVHLAAEGMLAWAEKYPNLSNHFLESNRHLIESSKGAIESVGIWTLAIGVIVPIFGLGARVWLGAFEPHRSANLFACKAKVICEISEKLKNANTSQSLSKQIAYSEEFLEGEHREWLRLMLETEWLL